MNNPTGGSRDEATRNFFKVPPQLMEQAAKIGAYAVAVYTCLAWHADREGRCWPSHETIKNELKVSKPTVIKALESLKDAGLISIEERLMPVRGQSTNVYALVTPGLYTGVNVVDSGLKSGVNHVDSQLKTDQTGVNVVDWGSQPRLPRSENPRSTGVNVVDSNKSRINKNQLTTTTTIAGASENGGGVGGSDWIYDRFVELTAESSPLTDEQIETIKTACGPSLTPAVLDGWRDVIQWPPKGLDNPVGAMIARLSRGNVQIPRTSKPRTATNGYVLPAGPTPEIKQQLEQDKAELLQRFSGPPRMNRNG